MEKDYRKAVDQLPGKYALPQGRLYIACSENKKAGCIALRRVNDEVCEAKRLYNTKERLANYEG